MFDFFKKNKKAKQEEILSEQSVNENVDSEENVVPKDDIALDSEESIAEAAKEISEVSPIQGNETEISETTKELSELSVEEPATELSELPAEEPAAEVSEPPTEKPVKEKGFFSRLKA